MVRSEADEDYVEYVSARLPALKRLAHLLCGDDHRADDLVQESVTKLYTRWHNARKATNLDSYVRAIVVRTHIDNGRRPWSRVRLFGHPPDQARPESSTTEDRAVLRAALAALPAGQRAVLVLRFLCDLPVAEVGELLGCSPGTVKSQTSHGLANVRQALTRLGYPMTAMGSWKNG
ncbi:SigE family RNA polymerase sigma factor [Rugosimonospora africana]|uniref:SigE family RNA polymerase sigma factor n=1 Tax=Rugosimonospora africana TaxID=556532 RepID=UPI0027E3D249|nr:SigE family RNA polymerase sigma factor [Rugosimonospora africana]